jgi:hypothetical protein
MKFIAVAIFLAILAGCDLIGEVVPILKNPLKVYCKMVKSTSSGNIGGGPPTSITEDLKGSEGFDFIVDHTAGTISWQNIKEVLDLKYRPSGFVGSMYEAEMGSEMRMDVKLGWDYSLTFTAQAKQEEELVNIVSTAHCEPYTL